MTERIQTVRSTNREPISIVEAEVPPAEYLSLVLRNPLNTKDHPARGWWFLNGDPEFWKFSDRLVVLGGKALDLGMGLGRTALPFALGGMEVTGYDSNWTVATSVRKLVKAYPFLPITVKNRDVRTADLGRSEFDTAILGDTFAHFLNRESAYTVMNKALVALKPGGHLYVRATGVMDSEYDKLVKGGMQIGDHLMEAACRCSGELKFEPHLFFEQTEILQHLIEQGLEIVHSQVLPQKGQVNIMYGEDAPEGRVSQGGRITVIAQKKAA